MPDAACDTKSMRDLVEGGELQRVDVLLIHTRRKLLSWIIRFAQKSYWNHVALVYVIRDQDRGYNHTFVIESEAHGVDIHKIDKYLCKPKQHDIAVLRVGADWFENNLDFQRQVRGFLLNEIDASYDYARLIQLGIQLLFSGFYTLLGVIGVFRRRGVSTKVTNLTPPSFICSGLAQVAYYHAAVKFDKPVADVIADEAKRLDAESLRSTTPRDYALSDQYEWQYFVKDGEVVNCDLDPQFIKIA